MSDIGKKTVKALKELSVPGKRFRTSFTCRVCGNRMTERRTIVETIHSAACSRCAKGA